MDGKEYPRERPHAIVWFERFYLASIGLKLLLTALEIQWFSPGNIQIGLIVSLLLWFGVVYRHSRVTRWITMLFFPVTAFYGVMAIGAGFYAVHSVLIAVLGLSANAIAVFHLARPDADPWFTKILPSGNVS